MARRRALTFLVGGLLALTSALIATSGAALATSPNHEDPGCHATATPTSVVFSVNGQTKSDDGCESHDPTAKASQCLFEDDTDSPILDDPTACPKATPTPTATPCVVPDNANPDSFKTATICDPKAPDPTPTATPTSTPFESFQGETATAPQSQTPPPTSTGGSGSGTGSAPIFALLICLAFAALGLTAVQAQRRGARR